MTTEKVEDTKQKNVLFFNGSVIFLVLELIGLLHVILPYVNANVLLPQGNKYFLFFDKIFFGDVIGGSLVIIGFIGGLTTIHYWSKYIKQLKERANPKQY